ncbi:MAG: hypothetical protein AAGG38_04920 [Planctomycetota bacterium]
MSMPIRWYEYPLVPIWSVLFLLSLPILIPALAFYWFLYPERHAHHHDFHGDEQQRRHLTQWRSVYNQLTFRERWDRAWKIRRRRKVT